MTEKASKSKTKSSKSKSTSTSKSKTTKAKTSKAAKTTKAKTSKAAKTTKAKTSKAAPKKSTPKKPATKAKRTTKQVKKSKKKRTAKPLVEARPKKPRRLPLEEPVKGVLMNYQRGTVRQRPQYGLIQLNGITSLSEAAPYIGRSVILHFNEQTANHGRIVSAHGRNGVLRVRFRRSLAADALAKEVLVY